MSSSSQIYKPCLIDRDGRVDYYENVFQRPDEVFKKLKDEIDWRQDEITLYGKTHPIPRLQAWYGEPWASYTYSRIKLEPTPWTPLLLELKAVAEKLSQVSFDGVLCNLYRSGKDYAAWHSDNEKELGSRPTIASASFGATRRFVLKHHEGEKHEVQLSTGSLLVMSGELQQFWKHQLSKTQKDVGPRINLTFRTFASK